MQRLWLPMRAMAMAALLLLLCGGSAVAKPVSSSGDDPLLTPYPQLFSDRFIFEDFGGKLPAPWPTLPLTGVTRAVTVLTAAGEAVYFVSSTGISVWMNGTVETVVIEGITLPFSSDWQIGANVNVNSRDTDTSAWILLVAGQYATTHT